ncbi:hypothetical protein EON83_08425 [bacterium]|nr:MAG: hypothetical protein EON83_08425 [bacterium]
MKRILPADYAIRNRYKEQISEADKVVTRFEWTGTHQGDFLGIPATDRAVQVWGIVIDHFVESKIKNTRLIMDVPGLLAQLGISP